jgi:uncharacterized tellurite resistance protein B-like protein
MWKRLFALKSSQDSDPRAERQADAGDHRTAGTAAAGLLVELAHSDGNYETRERDLILRCLGDLFPEAEAETLLSEGEQLHDEAVDLYRYSKTLKHLSPTERFRLVEAVWQIIYADEERHAHEDSLARRLLPLIGVDDVTSGRARQRVLASRDGDASADGGEETT